MLDKPPLRQRAIKLDYEMNEWIEQRMHETGKTFTNVVKEALIVYRLQIEK